ncbi:hypothetical protein Dda_6863 [Drechslerella dactyloides]|uniref:PCI domain-containing protein n=1 Tax=Drechslerella dactyloides TaxID=74499 RepID=A0AAD6IU91_DREDA|nr:hypothetical protein Dda_6863 [Drechslerella dactyloides]
MTRGSWTGSWPIAREGGNERRVVVVVVGVGRKQLRSNWATEPAQTSAKKQPRIKQLATVVRTESGMIKSRNDQKSSEEVFDNWLGCGRRPELALFYTLTPVSRRRQPEEAAEMLPDPGRTSSPPISTSTSTTRRHLHHAYSTSPTRIHTPRQPPFLAIDTHGLLGSSLSADMADPLSADASEGGAGASNVLYDDYDNAPVPPSAAPIIVTDLPRFDLEQYIANYSGASYNPSIEIPSFNINPVTRLMFIGSHCIPLAQEALRTAIALLRQAGDVRLYRQAVTTLQAYAPNDPDAKPDDDWIERTTRDVRQRTDRLEAELKSYKNNMIKESIRIGHRDLGEHFYTTGDLQSAYRAFSRMRDYCTSNKQMIEMTLSCILICIDQAQYTSVQSNVAKIRNHIRSDEDLKIHLPKINIASGIAFLAQGNYLDAARSFIATDPAIGADYNMVATMNDVAVYGGLTALASMDRNMLKAEVLESSTFRTFLELEPHVRRAVTAFHSARYGECLSILEAYRNDYLLDPFLQKHVDKIYEAVRTKSIVQYFIPYSCVTLDAMSAAFGADPDQMEHELVRLIEGNKLNARIDTQNRLVTSKETQLRVEVHRNTLRMAGEYERAARLRMLQINVVRSGLEIRPPKQSLSNVAGAAVGGGVGRQEMRGLMFGNGA